VAFNVLAFTFFFSSSGGQQQHSSFPSGSGGPLHGSAEDQQGGITQGTGSMLLETGSIRDGNAQQVASSLPPPPLGLMPPPAAMTPPRHMTEEDRILEEQVQDATAKWREHLMRMRGKGGDVRATPARRPTPTLPDPAIAANQTDWPIWWMAPFFDRTSFGKEAATLVLGMMRYVEGIC
jgi:hypothetical protein